MLDLFLQQRASNPLLAPWTASIMIAVVSVLIWGVAAPARDENADIVIRSTDLFKGAIDTVFDRPRTFAFLALTGTLAGLVVTYLEIMWHWSATGLWLVVNSALAFYWHRAILRRERDAAPQEGDMLHLGARLIAITVLSGAASSLLRLSALRHGSPRE